LAFYDPDLAFVHDAGFGGFARDAAPGLLRRLRRAGIRDGLVVDLGCGSGIWARLLTDAGYDALGVDQSAAMLDLARRTAPRARFAQASALDFVPPSGTAAITALGEILSYAGDVRAPVRAAAEALAPGGLLLFDVAAPNRAVAAGRREGDGWLIATEATSDGTTLTRRIATFRRAGRAWRRSDETHTLRLFAPDEVLAELDRAGFDARRVRSYGRELRPLPGLAVFAARRR
jgi:SAM-dependent methyltransferase